MLRALQIFLLFIAGLTSSFCQRKLNLEVEASYTKVLFVAKTDPEAHPFVLNNEATNPLFFPDDVQQQFGQGIYYLHFSRLNNKIVAVPDGTGRVYEFNSDNGKLTIERLDNSTYVGYNFSALVFTYNDTLFSLGGYGFWKYNGILRYYDTSTSGWELTPTNIEVPVSGDPHYSGAWLNQQDGSFYYVARNLRHDERKGYTPAPSLFQDSTIVYRLDLKTKNWFNLGHLSKESVPYINTSKKIAELPFGELAISGKVRDKKIILINYQKNRIELLKDSLTLKLYNRIYTGYSSKFTWYNKGQLTLGPSIPDTVFRLPLNEDSFTPLPVKLYINDGYASGKNINWINILLFVSIGIPIGIFLGKVLSSRNEKFPIQNSDATIPLKNIFNYFEINILKGFESRNHSMLPEEVNVVLETDRKSVEVQKKYRSETIRGINEKCSKFLNTEKRLVLQDRLTDDRRQFIYRVDKELFKALREKTSNW